MRVQSVGGGQPRRSPSIVLPLVLLVAGTARQLDALNSGSSHGTAATNSRTRVTLSQIGPKDVQNSDAGGHQCEHDLSLALSCHTGVLVPATALRVTYPPQTR